MFKRALWLIVLGERRGELSLVAAWESYGQRYEYGRGMPCPFRFGKQRLLMAAFQTPDVEHEENWLRIVQLASVQLWLGRELAGLHLCPWERYLPQRDSRLASPSQVQRDWGGIIRPCPHQAGSAPRPCFSFLDPA